MIHVDKTNPQIVIKFDTDRGGVPHITTLVITEEDAQELISGLLKRVGIPAQPTPQSAPSMVQDKLRVNLRGWQFDVTKDEALVLIKELAAFL